MHLCGEGSGNRADRTLRSELVQAFIVSSGGFCAGLALVPLLHLVRSASWRGALLKILQLRWDRVRIHRLVRV